MSFMRELESFAEDIQDFKIPDVAGIDGDTIQIILIVIIALWLFRKLKSLFFFFLIIVGLYYTMYLV